MAARKDKDETVPVAATTPVGVDAVQAEADGIGQEDEFVNPAQDELLKTTEEAQAQGFYGVKVDSTPNHHYTVEGVVAGKPTPENPDGRTPLGTRATDGRVN